MLHAVNPTNQYELPRTVTKWKTWQDDQTLGKHIIRSLLNVKTTAARVSALRQRPAPFSKLTQAALQNTSAELVNNLKVLEGFMKSTPSILLFAALSGPQVIFDAMQSDLTNPELQCACCRALSAVLGNVPTPFESIQIRRAMAVVGLHIRVINVLLSDSAFVSKSPMSALICLGYFVASGPVVDDLSIIEDTLVRNANATAFFSANGVHAVVMCMSRLENDPAFLHRCLDFFELLAHCVPITTELGNITIPLIFDLIRQYPHHAEMQFSACMILNFLAYQNAENATSIIRHGLIDVTNKIFSNFDCNNDNYFNLFGAVGNALYFCVLDSPANVELVRQHYLYPEILQFVKSNLLLHPHHAKGSRKLLKVIGQLE